MPQFSAVTDALGSIALPCKFERGSDLVGDEDFVNAPKKFITIEPGHSYSGDTVYAKVLPYAMEDVAENYTILPVSTDGFPIPISPIRKVDFTYAGTDAIAKDTSTLLWSL